MAQLGRLYLVFQDTSGNARVGSSVSVYREGATVNGAQSGVSPLAVLVRHAGKIQTGDTVFVNGLTGSSYAAARTSATVITLSGFGGTLVLANGDRLVPSNNQPTIYSDDQGGATVTQPLLSGGNGTVSQWIEFGAYEHTETPISSLTTTLYQSIVHPTQAPGQIRYADEFKFGSSSGGLQEAINDLPSGGGVVRMSANTTYSISAAVASVSGLTLEGGGPSTIIVQTTNATGGITMTGTPLTFRNFLLRGTNVAGASAHGFNGGNNTDVLVENCTVERWGTIGINLANSSARCVVRNCNVQNNLNEGIYAGLSCTEIQILDNLVHDNLNNGIDCIASNSIVRGNVVYSNGTAAQPSDNHGILIGTSGGQTANRTICEQNVCRANNRDGIFVWGAGNPVADLVIRGNTCTGNAVRGIDVQGSAGVTFGRLMIANNVCQGNTDHGLLIDGLDDSAITGNVSQGNGGVGIYLTASAKSCSRNSVIGNVSVGNTGRGIYSDSASVTDNIVEGNHATGNGTANLAFAAGARNTVRNNKFGTADTQNITAVGAAIVITDEVMKLTADNSYTLTAVPTIADGYDKQIVTIINVDTVDTITLQDQGTLGGSNLRLSAATIALAPRDNIQLQYDSVIADWVQIGQVNVL